MKRLLYDLKLRKKLIIGLIVLILAVLIVPNIYITIKKSNSNSKETPKDSEKETVIPAAAIPKQPTAKGKFNYGEALQKSIFFYDCQRSGKLPSTMRLNWRGDSGLNDGKDAGLDLTGGWYDAGDNAKFNLPMAYSAAMLGWAVYEYRDAFEQSGQLTYIMDNIKWATDYFIKCHPSPDIYYYQVGDGSADHAWWGPSEAMPMARPSFKVDKTSPGSAVSAETAAALAVASAIFKDSNPEYSKKCLKHAKELYAFAESTKSDAGYKAANGFYDSHSGFYDELSRAGAWLYIASNDSTYLKKAEEYVKNWGTEPQTDIISYKWGHCWDDVHYGAELLLSKLSKTPNIYKESIERHLDWWTTGYNGERVTYTPKGLAWLHQWGSLRHSTTTAFLASIYADWSGCDKSKAGVYKDFALKQAEYALGSTGRSFVVGFGENPPENPHHRTAHGSWANSQTIPDTHRHTLYGALVGGPDSSDGYKDVISDYVSNEVACDYNAGFVGLMAKMYQLYAGSPAPDFSGIEKIPEDEIYVEAGVNASGTNFIEIKAILNNKSGWPARVCENLSFNYFMDLSEIISAGKSAKDLKTSSSYNQGAKISEIKQYKGNIYYVTIDLTGTKIFPGGQSEYKKEVQFRIAASEGVTFNAQNDYSYNGLSASSVIKSKYIPVYDKGVKIFGDEPGQGIAPAASENSTSKIPAASIKPTPTTPKAIVSQRPNTTTVPGKVPASTPKNSNASSSGGKVTLKYLSGNSTSSNSISPKFKIVNNGSSPINLSEVRIRYYYTTDGDKPQSFWCDWSSAGTSNVTGSFTKLSPSKKDADYYMEIGLTSGAGTLAPGKDAEVQARFSKNDWSNYNQSNDYSFNSSASGYTDWNKITVYVGGKIVFGIEP